MNMLRKDWSVNGRLVNDRQDQDACEFLGRFLDVLEDKATPPA